MCWLDRAAGAGPFGTILVRSGDIACEHYGGGASRESCWEIGSLRKSVAGVLLGMAVAEDRISLETVVHEVWPDIASISGRDKDRTIRMRHLATNTSGWMTNSAPGEVFRYNNAACTAGHAVLGRVYGQPDDRVAACATA